MVKGTGIFQVGDLFDPLEDMPDDEGQVIGLVRPHPDLDDVFQMARLESTEDWHDVHENDVAGFSPLRSSGPEGGPRLVRIFLRSEKRHALSEVATDRAGAVEGATEALRRNAATSVLLAGAQYCYFDANGRYVCIPI
ncbi:MULTISPECIES: hypothetical protein [unclassified Sphingomonas]|uniref:hypothetical protein n=1 Tax=unclassified Sphingomonas TaxID=196159 RepID=UPI001782E4B2|nr:MULTISPECIES: hypothetical protein [unclassified Sphingomonas]MBD8637863.1 hypothetical protein [Sphingomonas sp. CFBP 13733]MBD8700598.1 hypothetical protein [Sphingomonas sp. CFBP 13714]MBP2511756.1 hypothetical protein [Sphingomonas sp. PvP018]